jgi:hypothetical protein
MAEQPQEGIRFKEREFGTPVDLCRDDQVPGEAIALYVVMRSFGPFAEAKVSSYAGRLRWSDAKVRKYQKLLEKAKWIKLVREGKHFSETILRPGAKAQVNEKYLCRLWWMCAYKDEVVPQGIETGVIKTITPHGLRNSRTMKMRDPENRNPKALKVPQALKDIHSEREEPKPALSRISNQDLPKTLDQLNQLRLKAGLSLIADHPRVRQHLAKALKLYGESILPSYRKYIGSGDRYWSPTGFPLAGFVSDNQVENWRAAAPPAPRCNHQAAKMVTAKLPGGTFDHLECACGWASIPELRGETDPSLLLAGEKLVDAIRRNLSKGVALA